jgi:hypothetical protein
MLLLFCERGIRKNVLFEACSNTVVEALTREDIYIYICVGNLFILLSICVFNHGEEIDAYVSVHFLIFTWLEELLFKKLYLLKQKNILLKELNKGLDMVLMIF